MDGKRQMRDELIRCMQEMDSVKRLVGAFVDDPDEVSDYVLMTLETC